MKARAYRLTCSAIVLAAFGLRLFRLDFQSLWYDEGATWYVASGPWREMLARIARMDAHPPLYYALLKLWISFAGSQEDFILRFPSVLFGVLTVAIVYALGLRLLRSRAAALAGSFALAVSAQHIVFSQEVRMYSAAVFLGALGTLSLIRWLGFASDRTGTFLAERRVGAPGAGLIICTLTSTALLYTNYFGLLVIIFYNAVVFTHVLARRVGWRALAWWAGSQFAVALALLPIAGLIRSTLSYNFVWRPVLSFPAILADAWWSLTAASPLPRWQPALSALVMGALLIAGFIFVWRRQKLHALMLALYLVLPVVVLGLLAQWRPVYVGRYVLYALAPLALLAGGGLFGLGKWLGGRIPSGLMSKFARAAAVAAGAALALGLPSLTALRAYYFDPRYAREDFRTVAAHIQNQEQAGDALILLNAAYPFLHYYRGQAPHVILPPNPNRVESEREVLEALNALPAFSRAWLVAWQGDIADPEQFVETQLRLHGAEIGEQAWGGESVRPPIRAAAYAAAGRGFAPEPFRPLDVRFGDGALRLLGYNLTGSFGPGQRAFLSLWWAIDGAPPPQGKVFVHALAGAALAAGGDKLPLNNYYPFRVWTLGHPVHDVYVLDFPADAPAPPYVLEVGVYDPATLERWPALGQPLGDRLQLPIISN